MKPNVQWIRRSLQLGVLLVIIGVPLLMQYRVALVQHRMESIRALEDPSFSQSVLRTMDTVLRDGDPAASANATGETAALVQTLGRVQGNHWSAKAFGLSWTDPLATLESMSAARRVTLTVVMGLSVPLLLSIFLGRVFCSWICPAGLLFDIADKIRSSLPRSHHRRDLPFWRGNKYVLLGVGLTVSFIVGVPLLGSFYPPALLGREIGHAVEMSFQETTGGPRLASWFILTGTSLFLALLVGIELSVSRRMWCRYFCPGGALYSLLGRMRTVRLRNDLSVCTGCTECVPACPMGLNPMKNQFGQECDLCLECRAACQVHAIRFQFSRGGHMTNAGKRKEVV